ncbi:DUF3592 domain-containing protein [uncultured Tateyamaria sp.]|uniref:DUF3592 domain-containing protein n=1 Tax=uncultured Tateyamaria sp. TaxID=455651 RepID=UPI002614E1D5|nr:DUF3592 domain-containing protein [uncultured Tateyamaria sp.]
MKDYTNGPAPGFLRLWWGKGAIFAICIAMFSVFTTVGSYHSLKRGLAFDAEGVVVEAMSVDRRTKRVRRNDRNETDYLVTFRYATESGEISVEKKVDRNLYEALTPGQLRDVRYLAGRPRQMEHTIGKTWRDGQVMRWLSLAFGLAALGVFWWTARAAIEAIRARKYGRAEWATVWSIDERISRSKNSESKTYVLVWRDAQGAKGESLPSGSRNRYFQYGPTSKIEVFRDSRGKTWWVGDVGPRASAPTVPDVGKSSS